MAAFSAYGAAGCAIEWKPRLEANTRLWQCEVWLGHTSLHLHDHPVAHDFWTLDCRHQWVKRPCHCSGMRECFSRAVQVHSSLCAAAQRGSA